MTHDNYQDLQYFCFLWTAPKFIKWTEEHIVKIFSEFGRYRYINIFLSLRLTSSSWVFQTDKLCCVAAIMWLLRDKFIRILDTGSSARDWGRDWGRWGQVRPSVTVTQRDTAEIHRDMKWTLSQRNMCATTRSQGRLAWILKYKNFLFYTRPQKSTCIKLEWLESDGKSLGFTLN